MQAYLRNWKRLALLSLLVLAVVGTALLLQNSAQAPQWLWRLSNGGHWLLPLISVAALIDSVNPCAFSILLLTIAFLVGLGRMRSRILAIGGLYIAGIFVVYLGIGLGILQALHLFNTPHFMGLLGAVLLMAFGLLSILGEVTPAFPVRLHIPDVAHHGIARLIERASLPVAFPLGALVGLCEFPCTGGPYLMAIGLLHDQGTRLEGLGYLGLYNVIFILPLVLILLVASDRRLLETVQGWQRTQRWRMRVWGGAAMVALGALIFYF